MNRTNSITRISLVLAAVLSLAPGLATSPAMAADDAGVPGGFLRFGASARSLALGNAVTGAADDAATSYWNPAGLSQLRTMEITAMGATMYNDTRYSFIALGLPTESWGTFALNGTFTNSGEFERSTWDADLDETFSEKESIFSLGYANGGTRFTYGVNLKAVSQNIGGASGSSTGLDIGLMYRPHRRLSVGGAIQNLVSPKITLIDEEEELVRSARAGLALRFFGNRLRMTTDVVETKYMDTSFRGGLELAPLRSLVLRGGYDSEREHMSAGAGFQLENWQFDYAYVSTDLGAQNVFSATLRFGVPFGVKMKTDRALFSPSGSDHNVTFEIQTAVRGNIESWHLEITDEQGRTVRILTGNGVPPEGVTWAGEDENGRLVDNGQYDVRITVVDDLGQAWDYLTDVEIMGFADRTRVPIRVEVSGNSANGDDANSEVQGGSK
ncbi:MAG: PorV/PorQ family protein [Candidatus Krumholzibacteria bacterium]|nr:PorV/PorQ family protein [Candidatus Krumholzibacteria bacterium]